MCQPLSGCRVLAVPLFVAFVVSAGCGDSGPKLYPVKGSVFYGDQPAEGATVVFQPKTQEKDAGSPPSGTVGADGSFTVRTHPHGEGAPPGEYTVLVTWYPENARSLENPKSKLPAKYADPAQTPLKATVGSGPVELEPFKIPSK